MIKMNEKKLPNYQVLVQKMLDLVKGENYDDVENAVRELMISLKRRSIIN